MWKNGVLAEPGRRVAHPDAGPDGAGATDRAETIRRLFQEHNRALVSFLTARLHCEQEARDVAQEAYVRLLQLERPGALSYLRAYLFRTAANLAVDRVRQRAVRNHVGDGTLFTDLEDPLPPERCVLAQQEVEQIGRKLSGLPAPHRHAFVMHVLRGRPVNEIAAEMGLTARMVRYYIVRGLMVCRKAMHRMERS